MGAFERVRGIEPLSLPWEGSIEPLNYTRVNSGSSLSSFALIIEVRLLHFLRRPRDYRSGV